MILNTFLVLGIVLDTVTWCVATHFTDLRSYIGFTGMSSHDLPGQGKHLVEFFSPLLLQHWIITFSVII